jgi:hypothetical protein
MDPLDPAWREHISLTDVLLTTDPPEVVVHQLLRCVDGLPAIGDILTLDLQYERQTVAHLQQEIVALQDERIQWHEERAELTE